jgi:hypothetical protein
VCDNQISLSLLKIRLIATFLNIITPEFHNPVVMTITSYKSFGKYLPVNQFNGFGNATVVFLCVLLSYTWLAVLSLLAVGSLFPMVKSRYIGTVYPHSLNIFLHAIVTRNG